MEGIGESLAGRIAILDLMGLSYREKIGAPFSGKPFLPSITPLMAREKDGVCKGFPTETRETTTPAREERRQSNSRKTMANVLFHL
jgi:hypothetical protein